MDKKAWAQEVADKYVEKHQEISVLVLDVDNPYHSLSATDNVNVDLFVSKDRSPSGLPWVAHLKLLQFFHDSLRQGFHFTKEKTLRNFQLRWIARLYDDCRTFLVNRYCSPQTGRFEAPLVEYRWAEQMRAFRDEIEEWLKSISAKLDDDKVRKCANRQYYKELARYYVSISLTEPTLAPMAPSPKLKGFMCATWWLEVKKEAEEELACFIREQGPNARDELKKLQ